MADETIKQIKKFIKDVTKKFGRGADTTHRYCETGRAVKDIGYSSVTGFNSEQGGMVTFR